MYTDGKAGASAAPTHTASLSNLPRGRESAGEHTLLMDDGPLLLYAPVPCPLGTL